jgi:hypothetical protein
VFLHDEEQWATTTGRHRGRGFRRFGESALLRVLVQRAFHATAILDCLDKTRKPLPIRHPSIGMNQRHELKRPTTH